MESLKNDLKMAIHKNDIEKVRELAEELDNNNEDLTEFYNMVDMLNRTKQRRGHYEKVKTYLWKYI
jgi:hypothetical protein